jgi:hypothetical protein
MEFVCLVFVENGGQPRSATPVEEDILDLQESALDCLESDVTTAACTGLVTTSVLCTSNVALVVLTAVWHKF